MIYLSVKRSPTLDENRTDIGIPVSRATQYFVALIASPRVPFLNDLLVTSLAGRISNVLVLSTRVEGLGLVAPESHPR